MASARCAGGRSRKSGWRRSRGRASASRTSAGQTGNERRRAGRVVDRRPRAGVGGGAAAWRGRVAVGRPRRRGGGGRGCGPGDEARRHVDRASRPLRARRRAAVDPPRAEHRDRVRAVRRRDARRDRRHRRGDRLDARVLRTGGGAPSGAPGGVRPRDRRQRLEPLRSDQARARDRLHRRQLVDLPRLQPRRQLHRRRRADPPRRARRRRSRAAAAAAHARRRGAMIVPASAAGSRLDKFLAELLGSRAAAERAIAAGALVDGVARPKSHRLEGGEEVTLPAEEEAAAGADEAVPDVRIAYEDPHLLVVDKPAGLVVHHGAGHARGTLVDVLAGRIAGGEADRPGVVHRLDRDTSGLLVLARTERAYERLARLVRERALERTYLALVRGRPQSRRGRIEAAIGRDRNDATRVSLDTDTPREAVTHFEVEQLFPEHALLRVALELPVVGDPVYGVPEPALGRQFLHAAALAFPHPVCGERVETVSALPPELVSYLDRLG